MRCAQMAQEFFPVGSSSSDKHYEVRIWRLDGEPQSCNCIAWVMKRNKMKKAGDTGPVECKHIKEVIATVCHWEGDGDVCGVCGGPVVDGTFTAPVAPITEAPSVPEPVVPNGPKLPAAQAAAALVKEMRCSHPGGSRTESGGWQCMGCDRVFDSYEAWGTETGNEAAVAAVKGAIEADLAQMTREA